MTTATIAPRRAPLARWWPAGAGLGLGVALAAVGSLGGVAPWVAGGVWLVAFGAAWRWGR